MTTSRTVAQQVTAAARYGAHAEAIAAAYLHARGYGIRWRNARAQRDEIDVIACDSRTGEVVYVEVKARTRTSRNYPIRSAVTARKMLALRRAMHSWTTLLGNKPARLDIVCVAGTRVTQHIQNVGSDFLVE